MSRLLDSPWFYFAAAGLLTAVLFASQFRFALPPKPVGGAAEIRQLAQRDDLNVVFLVVDTLRADHLSSYGYERPTSPNLEALASTGVRFANVESQSSWTKTSMASLWTGLYPEATGIMRSQHRLPEEATLAAELFQRAGFRTAGIWRNGWVAPNFGFAQGFDLYVKPAPTITPDRIRRKTPGADALQGTDIDTTDSAVSFVHSHADERFFLYLHYMDVHQYTYNGSSDLFGSQYIDAYDNSIRWVDENIGLLLEALRNLQLLERTVIVLISDHGEAFREHGNEGHAKDLHVEVQRVPWQISLPFDLPGGAVVETPVASIDVIPTLLDLLGLEALPDIDGISQVPAILAAVDGLAQPEPRPIFAQLDRFWGKPTKDPAPFISLLEHPYRLHHRLFRPGSEAQLYDHTTDPREERNIASANRELVTRMLKDMEAYLDEREPVWGQPEDVEIDTMMRHQLRALGYEVE